MKVILYVDEELIRALAYFVIALNDIQQGCCPYRGAFEFRSWQFARSRNSYGRVDIPRRRKRRGVGASPDGTDRRKRSGDLVQEGK
jgi:hypothetical protein